MFKRVMSLVMSIVFSMMVMMGSYIDTSANSTISESLKKVVELKMKDRGIWLEECSFYPLYNENDELGFVMSVTETDYLIYCMDNDLVCEWGEGNPYSDYLDEKKYYGGPLCYFIGGGENSLKKEGRFFNICNGRYQSNIDVMKNNEFMADTNESVRAFDTYYLENNYNYIRRRSFGYNDDGTCSAVACGIALNYIKRQFNLFVVTNLQSSELLNDGIPTSSQSGQNYIAGHYPAAYNLHHRLVDDYNMGTASYASGIVNPLNNYLQFMIPNASDRPTVSYTLFPNYNTIKNNITANRPVLITSTIAGDYSWHTMVVYGCRTNSDNSKELLVHTGWYGGGMMLSMAQNKYYHKTLWLPYSYATYGYYFTIPNS
ncbi:MAG: hypothetical protein IKG85_02650 [Clostridia bacterium]|nr:hypothetical protein [Clostridia bacterium]